MHRPLRLIYHSQRGARCSFNVCRTVQESSSRTIGYDVRYRLGEEEGEVRMDHEPGPRIPVKGGKLQLDAPAS